MLIILQFGFFLFQFKWLHQKFFIVLKKNISVLIDAWCLLSGTEYTATIRSKEIDGNATAFQCRWKQHNCCCCCEQLDLSFRCERVFVSVLVSSFAAIVVCVSPLGLLVSLSLIQPNIDCDEAQTETRTYLKQLPKRWAWKFSEIMMKFHNLITAG